MKKPALVIEDLVKRFGDVKAVDGVSFAVEAEEFLALLGPSGSGKTTILRLIGGFEEATSGRIVLQGKDVRNLPPHKRNIGVVFQKYALFPHMTVAENIGYPLRRRGKSKRESAEPVRQALDLVGLAGLGDRYSRQLSGGQQQRVALARAVVFRPDMLLMDEPLGALDKKLRERMQYEIRSLQKRIGITTIYVTHDQTEAMVMADRIAVIHQGRIEQIATPREIYERPATRFVADFIGNSNLLEGRALGREGDFLCFRLGNQHVVRCPWRDVGGAAFLLVRPEKIKIIPETSPINDFNRIEGQVRGVTFLGDQTCIHVQTPAGDIDVMQQNHDGTFSVFAGDRVALTWSPGDCAAIK